MGSIVTEADLGSIQVKDQDGNVTRHEVGTILWTAGVAAPPLAKAVAKATGAETDRAGRLLCGQDLSLPGHPEILVTGDLMCLDKLPGVAEVAMQSGLYAGRKIGHLARGEGYDKPFRYHDLGSAAYISRGRAVVSAFGLNFGGFIGWWVWLFIHIGFLTGYRNRVGRDPGLVVRVHPGPAPGADVHRGRHAGGSRSLRRLRRRVRAAGVPRRGIRHHLPGVRSGRGQGPTGAPRVAAGEQTRSGQLLMRRALVLQAANFENLHAERLQPGQESVQRGLILQRARARRSRPAARTS